MGRKKAPLLTDPWLLTDRICYSLDQLTLSVAALQLKYVCQLSPSARSRQKGCLIIQNCYCVLTFYSTTIFESLSELHCVVILAPPVLPLFTQTQSLGVPPERH